MKGKFLFVVIVLLLISCSGKTKFQEVELPEERTTLSVARFDNELFEADKYNLKELNLKWVRDYGLLYESFISQMLREGLPQDPMITYRLEKFLNDSIIGFIRGEMNKSYSDFSLYEKELETAFSYYHHYFPEKTIPKIVTFYSNFNAKTFPYSDTLGIGLDLFIGRENPVTEMLPSEEFPAYMKKDMDSEYLVSEVVKSWIYFNFSRPNEYSNSLNYGKREDFLTSIIYHGKMMLALEAMLPYKSIATLFAYTDSELAWCTKNEKFLYQNLVEYKLIYSTNLKEISSYINPGSFTPGLPAECPGGVGKWIGYRMVKQYFEENDLNLQDFLQTENDARKVLSYYTP